MDQLKKLFNLSKEDAEAVLRKSEEPNVFERLERENESLFDKLQRAADYTHAAQSVPDSPYNAENIASGFMGSVGKISKPALAEYGHFSRIPKQQEVNQLLNRQQKMINEVSQGKAYPDEYLTESQAKAILGKFRDAPDINKLGDRFIDVPMSNPHTIIKPKSRGKEFKELEIPEKIKDEIRAGEELSTKDFLFSNLPEKERALEEKVLDIWSRSDDLPRGSSLKNVEDIYKERRYKKIKDLLSGKK